MRDELERLKAQLEAVKTQAPEGIEDLAQGDDPVTLKVIVQASGQKSQQQADVTVTWNELFSALGPLMFDPCPEYSLRDRLATYLYERHTGQEKHNVSVSIHDAAFQTVKVQLFALGLIRKCRVRRTDGSLEYKHWRLTPYGVTCLTRVMAARREPKASE